MQVLYYSIKLNIKQPVPGKMFVQEDKNEMFLSAHGLLAGLNRMAKLDSRELAEKFIEAYMPRLQARYGADMQAGVSVWKGHKLTKHDEIRVKKDSEVARKRLETGILASNKRPE